MKKIKIFLTICALSTLVISCENDPQGYFAGKEGVYFSNFTPTADSITYSFLGKAVAVDTVYLNVKLMGYAKEIKRKVKIRVVPELTTAIVGQHYEPLLQEYEFPENSYDYPLPVVLLRHSSLDEQPYTLALELVETDDFRVVFEDNSRGRIVFSNIVMKPAIWDATLAPWFGPWSRIKHIVCMEITGIPFPQTTLEFNLGRDMWRNFGWQCNNYFKDNVVMDTDVDPPTRILPWM